MRKYFIICWNINVIRVNILIWFTTTLNIILNGSIWPIERTLLDTTTPGQSGSENNGCKEITPPTPELQNLNLTTVLYHT